MVDIYSVKNNEMFKKVGTVGRLWEEAKTKRIKGCKYLLIIMYLMLL